MVRRIVGAIVAVGRGKADEKSLIALLENSSDLKIIQCAPPEGLFLEMVFCGGKFPQTLIYFFNTP
jgi:tRNA U38,U39,U40 pseudouridine synthase TruA